MDYDSRNVIVKMAVHNEREVRALIKEAYARGNELEYHGTVWNTHGGGFICVSLIRDTEFELQMGDKSSLTIEVL